MKLKLILIIGFIFNIGYSQLSNDKNYIYIKTYKNQVNEATTSTNDEDYDEVVTYIDGKGRKKQTTLIKTGGNNEDIILYNEYDNINRQLKQFLPYVKNSENGSYVENINALQQTFYNTPKYENTINPYKEIVYDEYNIFSSQEIAHEGNDWEISNGRTLKSNYSIYNYNSPEDIVYKYSVAFDNQNNPFLSSNDTYLPKTLIKYISKNENWVATDNKNNTTETFKDLFGRIILKRLYNNDIAHDTYYIYDSLGNLTYMIPPEVDHSDLFNSNNTQTSSYLQTIVDFCFQYKYDYKNRLIEKKIPGKGWVYIVYDKLNRLTLTQNQKQRLENKWSFIEYDVYGRIVYEGELIDSNALTRDATQNIVSQLDTYVTYDVNLPFYYTHYLNQFNLSVNLVNYYDNYNFDLDLIFVPNGNYYNEKITTLNKNLITGKKIRTLGREEWETNVFFYDRKERNIKIVSKNQTLETLNSIDYKLDFSGKIIETKSIQNKTNVTNSFTSTDEYSYDKNDRLVKHQQYVNNKPKELISALKYDELGKLIEKKVGGSTNLILNGISNNDGLLLKSGSTNSWTNATLYSQNGIKKGKLSFVAKSMTGYLRIGLSYNPSITNYNQINYSFNLSNSDLLRVVENGTTKLSTYYHTNDLLEIERKNDEIIYKRNGIKIYSSSITSVNKLYADGHFYINNSTVSNLSIEDYDYESISALQKIDYKYNIQGDLTKINDVNTLGDDLFALEIRRNNPTTTGTPLYNGNVSQIHWKTANDNQLRYYDYSYDKINRIKNAKFYNVDNPLQNDSFNLHTVNYDKNGNITFLHRAGDKMNQANLEWMDFMTYSYEGNQLKRVKEEGHGYFGHITEVIASDVTPQYEYDVNGDLTKDRNKKITNISYNHLSLPVLITFEGTATKTIEYVYDASGKKLQKVVNNNGNITTTEYGNGCVYKKVNSNPTTLEYIQQAEGYIIHNNGSHNYVYNHTDHLGNIRLTYTDSNHDGVVTTTEILEENNYYPFGMKHKGYNNVYNPIGSTTYKYGFEGQEHQEDFDLNWVQFKWRNEDPAIGRFFNIDPLAEKYSYQSTYQFASNQPIHAMELEGMESDEDLNYEGPGWDGCEGPADGTMLNEYVGYGQYGGRGIGDEYDDDLLGGIDIDQDYEGSYGDENLGSSALRMGSNFIPILGSSLDIYEGIRDGDGWQVAMGIGFLALDIVTLGSSSVVKGSVVTAVKATKNVDKLVDIYKGVKNTGNYFGQSVNLAKRYSKKALREEFTKAPEILTKVPKRLANAVEQQLISIHGTTKYGNGFGGNKRLQMSLKNQIKDKDLMKEAMDFLDSNVPGWMGL